jgi:M6 family metalloprotease-like protein
VLLALQGNAQVAVASDGGATAGAASETRTGWITIAWGDGGPGASSPVTLVAVTDDAGQSTPILLDESQARPFGGVLGLNHRRVVVRGRWEFPPGAGRLLRVESLALDSSLRSAQAPASSEAQAVTGPQPWINILCKFSDVATEPKPLSYFNGLVGGSRPGLDHYWREASYDAINIVGSGSVGWYALPQTRTYYVGLGGSSMLTQLFSDCTGAADAAVNFSTYVGVNLMFNGELDGSAWGGSRWATLDGQSRFWYTTWEPPWGYGNQTVLAHEMGHGFGLPHSSGDYGATYDNQWDVMSDSWTNCSRSTDPTYGCLGQHTNSYHKDKLGWFTGAQKITVSPGSFTISLEQLALPQTGNYRMAQIPIGGSSTHFYTVEARRWSGYDVKLPAQAVIIHEVDTTRLNPAHVVDVDGNGNTGDGGARWEVGETFNDGPNGLSVTISSATTSGFVVTITLGGPFTPTATGTETSTHTATWTATATSTFGDLDTTFAHAHGDTTSTATPTTRCRRPRHASASNTPAVATFTCTSTNTPPPTATRTSTASNTPLPTATFTRTSTNTAVPPTATRTSTASNTPLPTATFTRTPTSTALPPTSTRTSTASNTPLPTATFTRTPTSTALPATATYTATASNTPLPTATFTRTPSSTALPPTATFTATASNTPLPTATFTRTPTNTAVPPTATYTRTSTPTLPPTSTYTATASNTPVATSTFTRTSTNTALLPTSTPHVYGIEHSAATSTFTHPDQHR